MAVFPIGMALSSHQYFAFKIWRRTSKLVSVFLRAHKIIQIYHVLGFAGVCGFLRAFCGLGVLRVILGAVMCIYMCWCSGYENGLVCLWDAARMQAMFSHIQNVNCGDSVATRKQSQAN